MDRKAPDAFRTISEVADELDLPQHVLRFWESRFRDIKPMKRGGGRRYYRPDDIDLLRGIKHLLYGEGYTIRGVQRILREQGVGFVQAVWRDGAAQPHRAGDDHVSDDYDADADVIDETMPDEVLLEPRGLGGRLASLLGRDLGDREDDVEARRDPPLQSAPMPRIDPDDRLGHGTAERRVNFEPARPEPKRPESDDFEPDDDDAMGSEPVPAAPVRPMPVAARGQPLPQHPTQVQSPVEQSARHLGRDDVRKLHAALHELVECRKLLTGALTRRG
ncbi:MAG: MerR family transcriptional regulator [Rhodopseudomonas sp.]|nr:MerR family transcriptional regulator [Rhodopseudomonas sp.]